MQFSTMILGLENVVYIARCVTSFVHHNGIDKGVRILFIMIVMIKR